MERDDAVAGDEDDERRVGPVLYPRSREVTRVIEPVGRETAPPTEFHHAVLSSWDAPFRLESVSKSVAASARACAAGSAETVPRRNFSG